MSKTVFNQEKVDFTKQPMFFGPDGGVQRYDTFKYPQFDKLNQTMIGYFWRPEEVSLQKDRADFQNFRPEQKHIFTSNLKYQTLLDSVQGRGPSLMFLPYVSINLFKSLEMGQLWIYASLSLIFFIPFIFIALSDQKIRHSKFDDNLLHDHLNVKLRTRDIIKDKKFYIYLPLSIAAPFISTGLMFHQIYIFEQKEWSLEMLGNGYILLGFFSIIGLLIGGPLIDKLDTKKTAITVLLPLSLSVIVLLLFDSVFFLILYMSLYGFNMGISTPFIGSLWAEVYGVKSLGTVKALLHAGAVFASALSPLVFGYIIDWGYGITEIAIISLLIIIVSTLLPIYNKLP